MAKEGNAASTVAAPKKNILVIIIAIAIAFAVGIGGAMLMAGGAKKHRKMSMDEMDDSAKIPMVVFKDELVVNLMSTDNETHYMRVPRIELDVSSEAAAARVEENRSKIGDRISSTLRSKSYQDMMQPGSDIALKKELRKVINDVLDFKSEHGGVKEVIFPGSFIVQ